MEMLAHTQASEATMMQPGAEPEAVSLITPELVQYVAKNAYDFARVVIGLAGGGIQEGDSRPIVLEKLARMTATRDELLPLVEREKRAMVARHAQFLNLTQNIPRKPRDSRSEPRSYGV
jgi:hypothetical protein